MSYRHVIMQRDPDGIAILTINRPEALNALNREVLVDLGAAVAEAASDRDIKVLIITGAGEKAFVAGADIAAMKDMTPMEARRFAAEGQAVLAAIENLEKPVIAAINGYCLGGGCELAMACDIRIASDRARLGQPEVNLGIPPGFAGTQRLARLVGRGKAKELIFTGEMIDAATAERIGLVQVVVPHAELPAKAREMARKIAAKSQVAVRMAKAAINRGLDTDLATGSAYEAEVFSLCFATADQKEGMEAFLDKRKPVFPGE